MIERMGRGEVEGEQTAEGFRDLLKGANQLQKVTKTCIITIISLNLHGNHREITK